MYLAVMGLIPIAAGLLVIGAGHLTGRIERPAGPRCATCGAAEDAHPDDPEACEIRLGCTTGYRVRRGAVAIEQATAAANPKAICGRCGRQGHTREECTA